MARRATIAIVVSLAGAILAGHAEEKTHQLSCRGGKQVPTSQIQSQITAQLILASPREIKIDLGNGNVSGSIISDNEVILRFRTNDFVGEFFRYSKILFLTYDSGQFARLTCSPA